MGKKTQATQEPKVQPAAEAQNIQNEGTTPAEPTATEPEATPALPQGEPGQVLDGLKTDAETARLALDSELAEKAEIEAEAARVALVDNEAEQKLEIELAEEALQILDSDIRFIGVSDEQLDALEDKINPEDWDKDKLKAMSKEQRVEHYTALLDQMWQEIQARRELEKESAFLAPYWESYPEAQHLYVTTDGMVFLQSNHNDAVNHARSLGTQLKSFTR